VSFLIADKGTVGFYNDFVGIAKVDNGTLLAPGVELDYSGIR